MLAAHHPLFETFQSNIQYKATILANDATQQLVPDSSSICENTLLNMGRWTSKT